MLPSHATFSTMNTETSLEQRALVWTVIATQFAPPLMFSGVAVLLPTLGAELHAGAVSLGLIESLFLASQLAFLLPIGKFADASDKRTIYKLSLLAFGICSLLIGTLSSMPLILAVRVLQGIASGAFAATGVAILTELVPPAERGRAFGKAIAAVYIGLVLGPVVAGFLVDVAGWRTVFYLGGGLLLVSYLFVSSKLPSTWKRPTPGAVHLPSVVLLVSSIAAFVVMTVRLSDNPLLATGARAMFFAIGVVLAISFVTMQLKTKRPLLDFRRVYRSAVLRDALLLQLLLYCNAFCSIFILSIYLQVVLQFSAKSAGQILALGTVLMTVIAPLSGRLADRGNPAALAAYGVCSVLIMSLLGSQLSSFSDPRTELVIICSMLLFQGIGFGLFSTPNMTLIMGSVSAADTGTASALGAKARSLGMVGGMLLTTLLISISVGEQPLQKNVPQFLNVSRQVFALLAVITTCALLLAIRSARSAARIKTAQAGNAEL